MRAFKKDPVTRDFVMTHDEKFEMVYDIDVIAQNCDSAMRTQKRSLPFNYDYGIEYFNNVFNSNCNMQLFESECRNILLGIEGVISIKKFDYYAKGGVITYKVTIETKFGELGLDGNI